MRTTRKRLLLLLVIALGAAYGAENKEIPPRPTWDSQRRDLGESPLIDRHALVTRHNVTINKPDPYASDKDYSGTYSPAASWLRANPHRLDLGQIGLRLAKSDASPVSIDDLAGTSQTLDLWAGLLSSRFEIGAQPVEVLTVCHPDRDLLGVRIESALLRWEGLKRMP